MGAGLWSWGDMLSTAEIWGSDSGLVFLLHNQFAVWIPLHITLNIQSTFDPAQSHPPFLSPLANFTSSLFHPLTSLFHLQTPMFSLYCSHHDNNSHIKMFRIAFLVFFFFFSPTNLSKNVSTLSISLQNTCHFPLATVDSAHTAF